MSLPLILTMGEPAGIGGEVALKAWLARGEEGLTPFCLLDDPARLEVLAARLGLVVPVVVVEEPETAMALFDRALPVLPQRLAVAVEPGRLDPANAGAVIAAIERAVALVQAGRGAAIVTNPISKHVLYQSGFRHPGHTEFLAALAGPDVLPVMMLACGLGNGGVNAPRGLRVVPVTIHVALREAIETLTTESIVATGRITAAALVRDFGIEKPRLAIAALNPHAGEGGAMGREEIEIIQPAIDILRSEGLDVMGPAPSDTLFHEVARAGYDVVLCMYHDQALIPLKTIDFAGGVNVTLGLPFVRTSPDHGTALDIAGSGRADPTSLLVALRLAAEMAGRRSGKVRGGESPGTFPVLS